MESQIETGRILRELGNLGYFSAALPEAAAAESAGKSPQLASALREFQDFYQESYGLIPTGQPDSRTRKVLRQPKCGCSDRHRSRGSRESLAQAEAIRAQGILRYAFDTLTMDHSDAARIRRQVGLAFATWQSLGRVTFTEVQLDKNPDVIVTWVDANGILVGDAIARADFPESPTPRRLELDDSEALWVFGEAINGFDIQTVALHEIGHLLGLDHVQDPEAVMHFAFLANRTKRDLRAADLAAFTALYP